MKEKWYLFTAIMPDGKYEERYLQAPNDYEAAKIARAIIADGATNAKLLDLGYSLI